MFSDTETYVPCLLYHFFCLSVLFLLVTVYLVYCLLMVQINLFILFIYLHSKSWKCVIPFGVYLVTQVDKCLKIIGFEILLNY